MITEVVDGGRSRMRGSAGRLEKRGAEYLPSIHAVRDVIASIRPQDLAT